MTWQNAVAIIYISTVALYVVFGFTIRDTHFKEVLTKTGIITVEIANGLLVGLKILYLMSAPALGLLGIHLAREIAIAGGAPINVTDGLMTGFQVFMGIYLMTLFTFLIILIKQVLNFLFAQADSIGKKAGRGLDPK